MTTATTERTSIALDVDLDAVVPCQYGVARVLAGEES